jgi:purine-binding chemotaxis protein CheW
MDVIIVEARGHLLSVPTAQVREVTAAQQVTPVPRAPPEVIGLTQVRGQIVPVLSVGGQPAGSSPRPGDPLVIVELGAARAALWVDKVHGVVEDAPLAEPLDVAALFDGVQRLARPAK